MLKSADNQLNDLRTFSLASSPISTATVGTTAVIIKVVTDCAVLFYVLSSLFTNQHKGEDT